MAAATRRYEIKDRRIEALEAENAELRRENERLKEALRLLPPESFLATYSLLYELAYLADGPKPEIRASYRRQGEGKVPIRDFRAHRMKANIDRQLYRLKYQIAQYLEDEQRIPEPDPRKWGKSQDAAKNF
ncbi:MAG: hypothetical protein WC116_09970 [Thermovirgaceae bacterium]